MKIDRDYLVHPLAVRDRVVASDDAPEDMQGYKGVIQAEAICFACDTAHWLVKFDHLEKPSDVVAAFLVREETAKS